MHRRFVKSLASVMGAAALVIAPAALLAPSAQADHVLTPDEFLPQDSEYNNEDNWVLALEDEGYAEVVCVKYPETEGGQIDDPFLIPEPAGDNDYILAVVKGGSGEKANELYWYPEAGHKLSHQSAGNSHIILCTGVEPETPPEETPPTKKPPTKTGPPVETDRVSDTGSTTGLGVIAGGALIAGAGALFLSRRRQGDHR